LTTLVFLGALLAAAATVAMAQPCDGALPEPAAVPASAPGRFTLIEGQCPLLAAPGRVHRAAQLGLLDHGGSVSITLAGAPLPPAAEPASPDTPAEPLGREGVRIVALAPALIAAARANDVDPLLLHAIAHVESRHNAQAVSAAGARGVMQVMPATARRFGVADPERTLLDAPTNLGASAAYLHTLRQRYGDDLRLVLAAYNAGEGAVEKHGHDVPPFPETQAYVRDVIAIYRRLQASFSLSPAGALVAKGAQS